MLNVNVKELDRIVDVRLEDDSPIVLSFGSVIRGYRTTLIHRDHARKRSNESGNQRRWNVSSEICRRLEHCRSQFVLNENK